MTPQTVMIHSFSIAMFLAVSTASHTIDTHRSIMYFPFKQHCHSLRALLLDDFILMASICKKKIMLCSVSKLGGLSI